jgi:MerR family transcriptional regulator, light-induced transcriptional regulator
MKTILSIKDLENLSGVKAHTIRIWEKRFNLIKPERTSTNIRYYKNAELIKLLNVTTLMNEGMKIGELAVLSSHKLNTAVEQLQNKDIETFEMLMMNKLIIATLNCDIFLFEKCYSTYVKKYGFEATVENLLFPLLIRIGTLWTTNKLTIAEEHFSSQVIRQKLFSAINEIPIKKSTTKFLIYLPEKQRHEVGSLYAHYLLKKSGVESVYLGPDVPLIYAKSCSEKIKPSHILCSFSIPLTKAKMMYYLESMNDYFKDHKVVIHMPKIDKLAVTKYPSMSFLSSVDDLRNML